MNFDTEEAITALVKRFANGSEEKIFKNDFTPQIAFYSEDDLESPRVIFFPEMVSHESRSPISWAVTVLSAGIDNLAGIAFIHDGYNAASKTKTDGTDWEPGDMQRALIEKTEDAHLISEALYYSVVTKEAVHMAGVGYDRDDTTITFNWDTVTYASTMQDKVEAAGFYPDMMRRAMDAPKIIEHMAKQFGTSVADFGLDEAGGRLHTLSICTKMVLIQTGMLCMIPCRTAEEQELLQRSIKEGPFSEHLQGLDQDDVAEIVTLNEAFAAPSHGE